MAMLNETFNAEENFDDSTGSFEPIPAGWYTVQITDSELKPTKAGTGEYLECKMEVLGPSHAGRFVWDRFNLKNPNEVAVRIGKANLAAVAKAVGVATLQDSATLHMKPFAVKLTIRPPQNGYEASNECKGYKAAEGATAAPAPNKPSWG